MPEFSEKRWFKSPDKKDLTESQALDLIHAGRTEELLPHIADLEPESDIKILKAISDRIEIVYRDSAEGPEADRAEQDWDAVLAKLDKLTGVSPEQLGKEFANPPPVLYSLLENISSFPAETRVKIAEAALENDGTEKAILENWSLFPGIDQRKVVARAGRREAGFFLLKYADLLRDLTLPEISQILLETGDTRGAKAFANTKHPPSLTF